MLIRDCKPYSSLSLHDTVICFFCAQNKGRNIKDSKCNEKQRGITVTSSVDKKALFSFSLLDLVLGYEVFQQRKRMGGYDVLLTMRVALKLSFIGLRGIFH